MSASTSASSTGFGEIKEISLEQECDVEWKIKNFTSITKEKNKCFCSPEFSFADATWCLGIYPNNDKNEESIGYINVLLFKKSCTKSIHLEFTLIIKAVDEKTDLVKLCSSTYYINGEGFGAFDILKTSEFLARKSEFAPQDVLTIFCKLNFSKYDVSDNIVTYECPYCNKTTDARRLSFHEKKCLDKPIKCPDCCDVVKLKNWYEHACQKEKVCEAQRVKAYKNMTHNFKDIMISGEHSDTVIEVKGVQFRLHRSILAARNTFFNAMFSSEMKECVKGTVTISDCEPDIFRQFVHYLYAGTVEKMSLENVCSLYEMADKYQDEHLKEECIYFMDNEISVECLCEFSILALKYEDEKLLKKAKEFFISRSKEIVDQEKWKNFAKEYQTQVNEHFIKLLNINVK